MCSLFLDFESEYNYLFKIINDHHNLEESKKNTDPNLLLLPNALRRFLETYTLIKIPSKVTVDRRAKRLFDTKGEEIVKFLHHHSHSENIELIGHHDSSILNLSKVCDEIIYWISENDNQHYKALLDSLN
jgi:wobble nucleotide-excising tRNase